MVVHNQVDGTATDIAHETTPPVSGYAEEHAGMMVVVHEATTGMTSDLDAEATGHVFDGQ